MDPTGMYGDRAALYDLIYAHKDYAAEAAALVALLRQRGVPDGARLLDVCCGTGRHLEHLGATHAVSGCDQSAAMLAVARARLPPSVPLWQSTLQDLVVPTPLDVVTCLFSSIGYLPDAAALSAGVARLAAAVAPGGWLVIESWITPEQAQPGRASQETHDGPDIKVARAAVSRVVGRRTVLDFAWTVATAAGVETFRERHDLFMATADELRAAMGDAGLAVECLGADDSAWTGRTLWLGRRPLEP